MGQGTRVCRHLCGIQTAWSELRAPDAAIAALAAALDRDQVGQVVAFFSPAFGADGLAEAFGRHFPGVPVAACTSAGEIGPAGGLDRGIVLIAFPAEGFRIVSTVLSGIGALDVERTAVTMRALRGRLDGLCVGFQEAQRFAISLIDGLSNAEEAVISAVAWALDGIPLVGGSAGDTLTFSETALIHDGTVYRGAAILLRIETDFPIEIFKNDNFEPTDVKFVVTATDHEARIVHELNAEAAAVEYAAAVGLEPASLSPMSFASHPLVVRVGGEYFCRSIRRLNADGSLSFFCAIDEGVVLTLAKPNDIVEATREELARLDAALGGLDLVIGFECVLRRLDAETRQVRHAICDLYRRYGVVGFETYGEQYRSMHLNQTLTGIAIGRRSDAPRDPARDRQHSGPREGR